MSSHNGKRRVKPCEARFLGNGNFWVDNKYRGWEVKCSTCPAKKSITSHSGNSSMPPQAIIKKLKQAGWIIGSKEKDDLCPACQRKPIVNQISQAKKVIANITAPMITETMHYSELEALALKLPVEQIRQLMKVLREALPQPVPKPKKENVPLENSADYEQWLETLK